MRHRWFEFCEDGRFIFHKSFLSGWKGRSNLALRESSG
jgi:hypothetical protein